MNKINRIKQNKAIRQGFTLVELVIYMTILGSMITVLTSFVVLTYESKIKSQVVAEVEQSGSQVMDIILQTTRNATLINTPLAQASGSSLSINTISGITTPTVFDLNNSKIRIKEGTGVATNLVGNRLLVNSLSFSNLTEAGASGTIRVQFTLTYNNSSGMKEYDYSKTFYGTASLRP